MPQHQRGSYADIAPFSVERDLNDQAWRLQALEDSTRDLADIREWQAHHQPPIKAISPFPSIDKAAVTNPEIDDDRYYGMPSPFRDIGRFTPNMAAIARACPQLSQMTAEAKCTAARKLRLVLS